MTVQAILQDMSLCMECQACRVACQMEKGLPPDQTYVKFRFNESGKYPDVQYYAARMTCQHCTEAECRLACPTGAVYKGESGLTHWNEAKCTGCGICAKFCPFGAIGITEGTAVRCDGCPDLTENGKAPVCVQTCIAGALAFGPRSEMLAKAQKRVDALKPTCPNAQIYSPTAFGGTNVIWVLRDSPAAYGLPENPQRIEAMETWRLATQPAEQISLAGSLLMGGLSLLISRRIELSEKRGGNHSC